MLLGATLLPVADVFSSEDLEKSTPLSSPNESETTDKGDSWSQLLYSTGMGVTFIVRGVVIGLKDQKVNKLRNAH